MSSTTVTIGQTQYTTQKIADHTFAEISVADFLEIPPAPVQRNSEKRVSKMKPVFDEAYAAKQQASLTEVVLGIVTQDFNDIDPASNLILGTYKKGQQFIMDGNTRRHYWKLNPSRAKELNNLAAKIHFLNDMEDVKFAYYPYNNIKSAEKASEILQGLARRYNWTPRQDLFSNGLYKTAIDWASAKQLTDNDIFENFNYCFEELKLLDSLPKVGKTISKPALKCIKSQPIIAAVLYALKNNPNNINLYNFIEKLCNITEDDLRSAMASGMVSPVEIIALEWLGWSAMRTSNSGDTWLRGIAGTTNFASQHEQMSFLVYWITEYIQNPTVKNDFKRGVRPSSWQGVW